MYLQDSSIEAITDAALAMGLSSDDVLILFLAEKNAPDLDKLISSLRKLPGSFIGGVFPGLISGSQPKTEGVILLRFQGIESPFVVQHLDCRKFVLPPVTAKIADTAPSPCTAIILTDGFAASISSFLAELFGLLGNSVHYFGAGAGFSDFKQRPCIFSPAGIFQNAAIIAFVRAESSLSVQHGWKRVHGPVVATKTTCNTIFELNWENAFDVYSEIIAEDCGKKPTKKNFAEFAQRYPFGLIREDAEDIVRDPIAVDKNGILSCVGEIPENTVLNILRGEKDNLIHAAAIAAVNCAENRPNKPCSFFIVDCISRRLFLKESIKEELEAVCKHLSANGENIIPDGVFSIGEISSYGDGLVDFLNKTIVVGALCNA